MPAACLATAILLALVLPARASAGDEQGPGRLALVLYPPKLVNAGDAASRVLPGLARSELEREGFVLVEPADEKMDPEVQFARALNDTIQRGAQGFAYLALMDNPRDDRNDVAVLRVFNLRAEGLEIGSGGYVSTDEETSYTMRLDKLSMALRDLKGARKHVESGLQRRDSRGANPESADPLDTRLLLRRRAELIRSLAREGKFGDSLEWNGLIVSAERDAAAGHAALGFFNLEEWFEKTRARPRPRWSPADGAEAKMLSFETMLAGLVSLGGLTKEPDRMRQLLAQHRACVELLERGEYDVLGRRVDTAGVVGNVLVEKLMAERDRIRESLKKKGLGQLNEAPPPAPK